MPPAASRPRAGRPGHPPAVVTPLTPLDEVLAALAHPGRRRIVELLACNGPQLACRIAASFPNVSRQTVSAHLGVLHAVQLLSIDQVWRVSPDPESSPEQRALLALANADADGRRLYYRLNASMLAVVALWLTELVVLIEDGTAASMDAADML